MPVTSPPIAIDLAQLARDGDLLVVSNSQPGIVVFTDDALKTQVVWQGKGNAAGGDVQQCPASFLRNPEFRRAILQEILVIDQAPEVLQQAVQAQQADWRTRQHKRATAEVEIKTMENATIARGVNCIAPKGRELCGSQVLVMGTDPDAEPPLCAEHHGLAGLYHQVDTGTLVAGKPGKAWIRR